MPNEKHRAFDVVSFLSFVTLATAPFLSAAELAFPGAEGWAAETPGGRGGRIIRVTTLEASGPGSFLEALNARGPRIIVFEVGGPIDLGEKTIKLTEPFVTIAGQTAPNPGVTLIRGQFLIQAHDVILRHLRIRPGEAGRAKKSGWEADGISTSSGARDVIVDHCSFQWATDENLSASGQAFVGKTPEEWRKNTSHRITFSNNIIAEGLSHSTHSEGEHSKGTLVMDNVTDVLIKGNLYASCSQRYPLAKGGTWVAVVNNFMYNPAGQAVGYLLPAVLWQHRVRVNGRMDLVGNVLHHGPNTSPNLALLRFAGLGDLDLHHRDNVNLDRDGKPVRMLDPHPTATGRIIEHASPVHWPPVATVLPSSEVIESVCRNAGARPWDRDATDRRIVRTALDRTGRLIDSQQEVEGYPPAVTTRKPFVPSEWDLETMTRRPPDARSE